MHFLLEMLRHRRESCLSTLLAIAIYFQLATTMEISSIDDPNAVRQATSTAAYGMLTWYNGNTTGAVPGNLPLPYYWWEAGAYMMTLIDYWYYTGADTYNALATSGILWQTGADADFMTPNQTLTTGNDDQSFWAFAAMDAAELKFPNPPDDQPQWLALAQAVFNDQTARWDDSTCGGGLRWQVYQFNGGWNYKNGISNGCYFSLGARLARYTANATYADYAEKMWDWVTRIGLVDTAYKVYDGTDAANNCSGVQKIQWTYNAGVFLHGAANMWNFTQDEVWKTRVDGLVASLEFFFKDGVMIEPFCEPGGTCDYDQRSFKAYLARWMAATAQLAPWTAANLLGKLRTSAQAAAQTCNSGFDGNQCILAWSPTYVDKWTGIFGPGEQMMAVQVLGANLISSLPGPVTEANGGISRGDPGAGTSGEKHPMPGGWQGKVTVGDRVCAGFVTVILLFGVVGGAWWVVQ